MTLAAITEFSVTGLHGIWTVRVPINDNKLILIGVNGIGKSTIITLFYYLLSRQWNRLAEYQFNDISLRIGRRRISVSSTEIKLYAKIRGSLDRPYQRYPVALLDRLRKSERQSDLELLVSTKAPSVSDLRRLAHILEVPVHYVERLRLEIQSDPDLNTFAGKNNLASQDAYIAEHVPSQILFLPTYRRIEKDLETIVPQLREEIRRLNERADRSQPRRGQGYLELVQFGMEDVDQDVRRILSELKETARTELNNLAGGYLRDVIRHQADKYDPDTINAVDEPTVNRILNRVEERTISQVDKISLQQAIARIQQQSPSAVSDSDRYVAHFFLQLARLDQTISKREDTVKKFVSTANGYLVGKRIIYDDAKFEISITDDRSAAEGRKIEFSMLSSGEKQIVSIFSHLYLSKEQDFAIIIDEPELSLSVDWQTKLLPDIDASGRVVLLAAVTHSPFIFDNRLDRYAVDLAKCISK